MSTSGGRTCVLSIDQGTTGTTGILFDLRGFPVARAYRPIRQIYPRPGWVEHDPEDIWRSVVSVIQELLARRGSQIAAIGITNQRETTVLWDRRTGRPIHNAIVWQDRRTSEFCRRLKTRGKEALVSRISGLVLDPYFSGTKIAWLLRNVKGAAAAAGKGMLAFGTVDSWLIWKLTGGKVHATDPTNASRTLLLNISKIDWDPALLGLFEIPRSILPQVRGSSGDFGRTAAGNGLPAGIPIAGVAGDQQAALFGQGCVSPGQMKVTYGTGAFLLLQCGRRKIRSRHGLLTTLACGPRGEATFVLEGSIFIAGAVVQWLRDELGVISSSPESEKAARKVPDSLGVYVVPAFVGLGAPWWEPEARGLVTGLTRGANRCHLVRASLESIAYQTHDVVRAMERDTRRRIKSLRVDGGAAANDLLMQFQADVLSSRIIRPKLLETTAAGAAYLAGMSAGLWSSAELGKLRRTGRAFRPAMTSARRRELLSGWHRAVQKALN